MGLWLVLVPPQFQPTGLVAGLSVSKEMMVVSVQGRNPFVDTAGISERGQIVPDGCGGWQAALVGWPPNTLRDVPRHPNCLFLRKPNALLVIVLGSHRLHNSFRLEFQGQT